MIRGSRRVAARVVTILPTRSIVQLHVSLVSRPYFVDTANSHRKILPSNASEEPARSDDVPRLCPSRFRQTHGRSFEGHLSPRSCKSRGEASPQRESHPHLLRIPPSTPASVALLVLLACTACGTGSEPSKRIQAVYDETTGRLRLLKYDSNGDGKVDTWSYMEGTRLVRIEIDQDGDGVVDRREHYTANQALEKVELVHGHDGTVTRVEYYEADRLVRAEEDSDGDGNIVKWETYDGDRLASVALDTVHRGTADRRLVYGADGSTRLEIDRAGDGRFTLVSDAPARHP